MCHCSKLAEKVVNILKDKGIKISTMESCTGGRLASFLTDVSGSSEVVSMCHVTYSDKAKVKCGVAQNIIDKFSVYSKEVALAMATTCTNSDEMCDIGIGITGHLDSDNGGNKNIVYFAIVAPKYNICVIDSLAVNSHNPRSKQKEIVCREVLNILHEILIDR